jgi:glycerol uptake facilitator-like aquaporin
VSIAAVSAPPAAVPPPATVPPLWRRAIAEAVGTGLLVAAIVGSGIAASRLSPGAAGLHLAVSASVTGVVLAVLIVVFLPLSGAHLNPAVTLVHWLRDHRRLAAATTAGAYLVAQVTGGVAGAMVTNLMFDLPAVAMSATTRGGAGVWAGEAVATAGLILVIGALARTGRTSAIPFAVAGWIAAAIWFTSSTSFANPAVTAGRMLTDSFTGISPASAPAFLAAQLAGAAAGAGLVRLFWPTTQEES